jgi:prophage regulatory protein
MERNGMSESSLEKAYAYAAQLQSEAARPLLRRHIRRSELRQVVPLSDTTIYEMEKRNEFPRRIVLMPRVVVWDLAEVEAWMEQRRQDTNSGKAKASATVDVRKRKRRPVLRS